MRMGRLTAEWIATTRKRLIKMAFPEATPVLKGKKAKEFLKRLEEFKLTKAQKEFYKDALGYYKRMSETWRVSPFRCQYRQKFVLEQKDLVTGAISSTNQIICCHPSNMGKKNNRHIMFKTCIRDNCPPDDKIESFLCC